MGSEEVFLDLTYRVWDDLQTGIDGQWGSFPGFHIEASPELSRGSKQPGSHNPAAFQDGPAHHLLRHLKPLLLYQGAYQTTSLIGYITLVPPSKQENLFQLYNTATCQFNKKKKNERINYRSHTSDKCYCRIGKKKKGGEMFFSS